MQLEPDRPVLSGTYPDPSICRVGDDFYLVTSTFEYFPGLPIFHSTDLVTWSQIGHVVDRVEQLDLTAVASSRGLYAPTIRHHDGTFYVVCTLVEGTGRSGNFVMTATDPAGPWSDPTWLDAVGFDPSLYFEDGRAWYVGTRLSEKPQWFHQAEVFLRELDLATMSLIGDERVLWHGAVEGAVWAEGPHIYHVGEYYYLVASEGGTEDHHAISVARSTHITGPYEGTKGNPIFTHRHLGMNHPIACVGHCDLVEAPDGQWWAFLLASRPVGGFHANLGRETFAVPVDWELGWPVFAPGVGQLATVEGARHLPPTTSDVEHVAPPLAWTQLRTARTGFATVTGDTVTLSPSTVTMADESTPSFLGVRQRHHECSFSAELAPTVGVSAGLVVRQSEACHLTFFVDDGTATVTVVDHGASTVVATHAAKGVVTLEVAIAGQDYELWLSTAGDRSRLAVVDGRFLSPQSSASFVGVWLGVAAIGADDAAPVTFTGVTYTARDSSMAR
jgi:xylan 1,4-beta-xylosidase